MKKISSTILALLSCVFIFSFTAIDENESEIKITVTANKETTFDLFRDGKTAKGLTTPYEIKVRAVDSKFIFKSASTLKVKVEKGNEATLTAEWPITVLLVENNVLTTFGMR